VTQDGTGSQTLAFGSFFHFAAATAPTLTTTANAIDRIDYIVNNHYVGGKSKDEVKRVSVEEYGIFPNERSFNSTWNFVDKISDSIKWVSF